MKNIRIGLGAAAVAALAATALSPAQAAVDETRDVPTYQEFKDAAYQDVDGAYVLYGDEAHSEDTLREVYDQAYGQKDKGTPTKDGLIVNDDNGSPDVWSASQVANLTYCVSDDFGSDKSAIVDAMSAGAGMWENASSAVDFVYVPSADSNCTTSNSSVLFSVEPVVTNQYIARAFFPSSPASQQNVLIADSIWDNGIATPEAVVAHELGHVLGFRHEHTRPEANPSSCYEDDSWHPVTPYDSDSIMHYPQCEGATSTTLSFSGYDAEGVRAVYGG